MQLRPNVTPAASVKIMFNIGALLDIPTGTIIVGRRGESIVNGGLSALTGVVGIGNNFKSTLLDYMTHSAMARVGRHPKNSDMDPTCQTYDTECNIQEWHKAHMVGRIPEYNGENVIDTSRWIITDKTVYSGNVWYENYREFLREKAKSAKSLTIDTPFWNREKTGAFQMLVPTFAQVDSFTEFETDDVAEMQDKNELGESGGNTIHMRQGLAKLRFLMEAPKLNCGSYNYLCMTAHLGKESQMQNAGPAGSVPITKLKTLKNGDKIKGVTDKFTFITHNCWHAYDATPLMADDKLGPKYPKSATDKRKLDTDLQVVKVRLLRGKSGASGMALPIIVSQRDGVLPTLTEFYFLKEEAKGFGFEGNNTNYNLVLYPDVKLSRTTVRSKIDEDALLRRAMNITSESYQAMLQWPHLQEDGLLCDMETLYNDLKAKGYDWNVLLDTRGWWTPFEEGQKPFLSFMDLFNMRAGTYHPYWMEPLKK